MIPKRRYLPYIRVYEDLYLKVQYNFVKVTKIQKIVPIIPDELHILPHF